MSASGGDEDQVDKSQNTSDYGNGGHAATTQRPLASQFPAFEPPAHAQKLAKDYRTEICAASASAFATFVTFPMDFTKSRMQSYGTTLTHTIKDAYKAEGMKAFWRGAIPPVISITASRTLSFSLYQKSKYVLDRTMKDMTGQSPLKLANAPGSYPGLSTLACFGGAGVIVGVTITTFSCPFELTKLNEQLAGKEARQQAMELGATAKQAYKASAGQSGSWATAKRLVRDRGLTGLYAGYRLHLLRDTLGTSLYFVTYETVKHLMANARGKDPTSPGAVFVAGGMCGVVSWACVRGD